jgi:hypothetical protein
LGLEKGHFMALVSPPPTLEDLVLPLEVCQKKSAESDTDPSMGFELAPVGPPSINSGCSRTVHQRADHPAMFVNSASKLANAAVTNLLHLQCFYGHRICLINAREW